MSRNLLRILTIIPLAAAALTIPAISETSAPDIKDDGRLPGDDIPATRPCCVLLDDDTYDRPENDLIEAALLGKAHIIEDCTVTHYDCCVACCGKTDGITASGVQATPGVTVAVDPEVIPLGSDVLVRLYRPKDGTKEFPGVLRGYEDGRVTIDYLGKPVTFEKSEVALARLRVEF